MQVEHMSLYNVLHEIFGCDADESCGIISVPRRSSSDLRPTDMNGMLVKANRFIDPTMVTMSEFLDLTHGFTVWISNEQHYYNIVPFEIPISVNITFHADELMMYYACGAEACKKMMPFIIDVKHRFQCTMIHKRLVTSPHKTALPMVKVNNGT